MEIEMPIRQDPRNGSWYYRFHRGRSYFKGGFETKQLARDAEISARASAREGRSFMERPAKDLTFGEACGLFFERHSLKQKRSWRDDQFRIKALTEVLGKRSLKRIAPEHLEQFLDELQARNGFGDLSRNNYVALVKAIYNRMRKWQVYHGDNPASYLEMRKVPRVRVRFLYPSEERSLTPAVRQKAAIWPYYFVGLHTGMRLNEMIQMRVEDVDLITGNIFIRMSKSSRSRHVPLSDELAAFLRTLVAGKAPSEPVLPRHCRWFISGEFTKVCRKAGIPDFVFHCLRHTFAARLLGRGVPIYKVSKILGHSGVQVTEQHYGHLNQADLHGAISAISGIVSEPFAADLQQDANPALQMAQ
jgi:integrase